MAQKNSFGLGPLDSVIEDWQAVGLGNPLQNADRGISAAPKPQQPDMPEQPQRTQQVQQPAPEVDARMPDTTPRRGRGTSGLLPPEALVPLFESAAEKYQVPVNVLMALAQQESSYNPNIVGQETKWGRAKGMMQYLDSTARSRGINPYDPRQAIPQAAQDLRERLDKGESMEDAVRGHFAGPDRKQWGPKTERYGIEVIGKARKIGAELYPGQGGDVPATAGAQQPGQQAAPQSVAETDQAAINAALKQPDSVAESDQAAINEALATPSYESRNWFERMVSDRLESGWTGLQAGMAANAARVNADIINAIERIDRGERVPEMEDVLGYQHMTPAQRDQYKQQTTESFLSAINKTVEKTQQQQAIPQHPEVSAALQAKTFGDFWDHFKKAPLTFIANVGVESAPAMAPGLIAGGVAGAAMRGGTAAFAAGMGAGSYGVDYQASVLEALKDMGIDATNRAALEKAFRDPAMMEQVRKLAHSHASVVGAMDAASGGVAGKALVPGKSIAARAGNLVAQTGVQGGMGMAGEAGGQIAQGKTDLDIGQIMAEGFGELAGAPVEVAGAALSKGRATESRSPDGTRRVEMSGVAEQPKPSGPLSRAMQAGDDAARARRVQVMTPAGALGGFMEDYQADGQGNFVARVLGDDGQVYQFTQADNVAIRPENETPALPPPSISVDSSGTAMTTDQRQQVMAERDAAAAESRARRDELGLTPDIERAAFAHQGRNSLPDTVEAGTPLRVVTREGEVVDGTAAAYERTADGAQVTLADADGNTVTLGADQVSQVIPQEVKNVRDDSAAGNQDSAAVGRDQQDGGAADPGAHAERARDVPAKPEPRVQESVADATADADAQPALNKEDRKPADMTLDELVARRKYLSEQAVANNGWDKRLTGEKRKIEAAIRKIEPKALDQFKTKRDREKAMEERPFDYLPAAPAAESKQPSSTATPETKQPAGDGAVSPTATDVRTPQGKELLAFEMPDGERVMVRKDQYDEGQMILPAFDPETGNRKTGPRQQVQRKMLRTVRGEDGAAQQQEGFEQFPADSGTLGIPRSEMPQVPTEAHGGLVRHLNAQGIEHETKMVSADDLKPTQAEYSPERVEKAKDADGDRSVIVSNDGHIIDGHHQALAAKEDGEQVKAIVLDAPVDEALDAVRNSPSAAPATPRKPATSGKKKSGETVYRSMAAADDALRAAGADTHEIVRTMRGLAVRPKAVGAFQEAMDNAGLDMSDTKDPLSWWADVGKDGEIEVAMRTSEDGKHSYDIRRYENGPTVETATATSLADAVKEVERMRQAAAAPAVSAAPSGAKNAPSAPAAQPDRFAGNKIFTADKVEQARARLRSKLNQLNSGIDPEVLADGMTLAGAYIESGVRDFAAYAKAMIDDLGDGVKPYLLSFYEGARNWPGLDAKGMTKAKEARRLHAELLKSNEQAAPHGAKIEQTEAQNDTEATTRDVEPGAGQPGAAGEGRNEGARRSDAVSGQPDGADAGVDQRGQGADRQRGGDAQSAVHQRGDAGADAELRIQGRGERGAGAGDRADHQPASAARNYRIADGELTREGSWKATAARNVDIVELVKRLEAEGRVATQDERAQLAKFTGWGASEIANGVFPDRYGNYKAGWEELGQRLKAALTPEEYEQASRSTQYAHYTSEGVIRSIYNGLGRLGFAGGAIVEPGAGVGHFNGLMPAGMAANSSYTGIEYDGLTGAIAKHLYPESNIIIGDYTKTALPKDFFDAAIGNPPFSSTVITNDAEYKRHGFMLHDYFFAKTLDRVKPGGVVVFVTSKGTMDKASSKARKYLADRANLVGAVRLPQTAFKDNAGTEVVTDVLFLQKRGPGIEDNGVKWLGTKDVKTAKGEATPVNEYFADHADMVLGEHALTGSMYRANEYTVTPREGDIEQQFAAALERLPENVYRPARGSRAERAAVIDRDYNPRNRKEGGLYLADDGKLMQVEDGSGVEVAARRNAEGKEIKLKPADKRWLKGYVGVRDALKQAQYDQLTDGNWQASMSALNAAYDAFVAEHGPVLSYSTIERTNPDGTISESKRFKYKPLFEMDAEGALAYAVEHIREDGTIEKGVALRERVLRRRDEPTIRTTQDAMFVALDRLGRLDIDEVARLAGTSRDDAISSLGTAIYEHPADGWQQADEYLSGDVVKKLKEARAAADVNPRYKRNVDALVAVQPRPLGPTDITVRMGANWVPTSDYVDFAKEIMGEQVRVTRNDQTGDWRVEGISGVSASEWGTNALRPAAIMDAVVNSRQIKVTYKDTDGKTHVDDVETEKANDTARKMREAFSRWIWTDGARADRLAAYYNEHFNNIAPRQYDGSHLTLPGVSLRFNLYGHQKRAIWRNIQDGDTYLAHAVGAGKTFTMIASGMEQKRLGLVERPWYVVPNHMLAQFSREFLELYPTAHIMVADEQNFHTGNRRRFIAQAALNNPDAVIITQSAFERISMSDEYSSRFIGDQIDEWKAALEDVDSNDRITRKQIERRIEQLERRLESKQAKEKKDALMTFEETGADYLFVDEAHAYRKLDFATNQGNIKGIDPSGSQRALDLFMKMQYLRDKRPGRAVTLASGTPVTNTMGELFTVQRMMDPDQLQADGLDSFDAWSAQYGDTATALEQNAAGGYEAVTRFARFQNVPELMRRVRSFMDIVTNQNLGTLVKRPDVEGGGRKIVVTPSPDGYRAYQKELEARIKAIRARKGPPEKGEDIILNVIADGRFSAIDMRFVDPATPADPHSKLNMMLDDIIAAYRETANNEYADKMSGQVDPLKGSSLIVFSDIGLGEQSAKSRGFSMKDWISKRLADAGIPAEHVAFIRDHKQHAKKERLFADMREGKKRILIGGQDMETGVNVQKRLTHLFHLDAPWFPASVEQREGRIIRQGNQNEQVSVRAYATKGSYDSTMWGMNARKARFIEQAMNGDDSVRSMDDVSEASSFEMASALASGDERYMKLAGLRGDVERLERLRQGHYDQQNKIRRDKQWAETHLDRMQKQARELKDAIVQRQPILAGEFSAKVGNTTFDARDEFSKGLFDEFKTLAAKEFDGERTIGEIGGFPIMYFGNRAGSYSADAHVMVPGRADPLLEYPISPDLPINGIAARAANLVNGLDRKLAETEGYAAEDRRNIEQYSKRMGAAFPEEADLQEKRGQLIELEAELAAESEAAKAAEAAAAGATVEAQAEATAPADGDVRYSVAVDGERLRTSARGTAELRGQQAMEIRSTPADRDMDKAALRDQVFGAALSDRSQVYAHPDVGSVTVSRKGLTKSRANASDRAKLLTVPMLGEIIRDGAYLGSRTAQGKANEIAGYHYLARRVNVDGVPLTALVTLEEKADGRVDYYNHAILADIDGAVPTATGEVDGSLASYRRPSFHPESARSRQQDAEGRHQQIRRELSNGVLGGVFDRLLGEGHIILHPTQDSLPRSIAKGGGVVQGFTDSAGRIHLVAENLTPQTAPAVLLHEAFHGRAEALLGGPRWNNLNNQLGRYYAAAQRRKAEGRTKPGDFWDEALRRVEHAASEGVIDPARAAEEFGAYAIENYDLAPSGIKKWVDTVLGIIKDWLARRFGIQAGEITPAQLRALAVAALRETDGRPSVDNGAMGGMAFGDGPMSVAPASTKDSTQYSLADKSKALDDAINTLDAEEPPARDDFVGSAIRDMDGARGLYTRFLAHPYHVASLYPEFTPVFQTATAQQQRRNQIIEDLHKDHVFYQDLPQESKANVNKVLELGRLIGRSWTAADVKAGVRNPGFTHTVRMDENNVPHRVRQEIDAQLSKAGDTIKLSDDEAAAYDHLRAMFDRALDKFRDQALDEFGMGHYAGKPEAAKAIMDSIAGRPDDADKRRMQNIAQFINDIEQAKRTGYVPFTRYGDYVVAVKERQADIQYTRDEDGNYVATNVPPSLEEYLDATGAYYDPAEQAWRLSPKQRADLESQNEITVYSEKVETGLRDMFGRNSERRIKDRQAAVSNIPSVKKAIDRINKDKVGDNANRRIVAFATSKKRAEGGVDMSSLDALAEVAMLDPATWEAVRGQLTKAMQAGGFRKHFFQSSNVPGYSADFERSMADYVVGLSGYLARREHNNQWDKTVADIKGEKLHRYATKYREYVNQPAEELALLRQTGFFLYLAGNVSTALLNMTQVPLMTMPFLSTVTNHPHAAAQMTRAYKDALAMFRVNNKTGYDLFDFDAAPADVKADLIRARDEGLLLPLQSLEIMGIAGRRSVEGRKLQKGYDKTVQTFALPFTATERLNRIVTFIAANRLARKPGIQQRIRKTFRGNPLAQATFGGKSFSPYAFAEFAVDETQFRMGKGNRPTAMRGVGTAIMQFKSFMLQFLEAMYRNATLHGKEGKFAAAATLGMLIALSGLWGAPGAEDLKKLFEGMYKGITKKDLDVRTGLRKWVYETSGQRWLSDLVDAGLPYTTGADMSRRVGMGNLMPDSRNPTGIDWLDSMIAFGGVPADLMVGRPIRAAQQLGRGDFGGAATSFMPNFVENARKAAQWSTDGVRTQAGRMVLPSDKVNPSSVVLKAIGVQPSQISDVYAYQQAQKRAQGAVDELKRQLTSDYVRAVGNLARNTDAGKAEKLQAEVQSIIKEIADHNATAAPDQRITLTRSSIRSQLQRELGGAPSGFGRERKAARGAAAGLRDVFGVGGQ